MRKIEVIEIGYRELEALIEAAFGVLEVEIVPMMEWNNDSEHLFNVDGEMDEYDNKDVDEFIIDPQKARWCLRAILNRMAVEGKLEKGKYLITVCW